MKIKQPWMIGGLVLVLVLLFTGLVRLSSTEFTSSYRPDVVRFEQGSVDVDMAMNLLVRDPPRMLAPPAPVPAMLLFPPSDATLEQLSGPTK
uniref:Uncharacterized protein n=1 Tax=viral metagenome TaxID=1070528 RepID=A0A6C0M0W7_9ZZZZ